MIGVLNGAGRCQWSGNRPGYIRKFAVEKGSSNRIAFRVAAGKCHHDHKKNNYAQISLMKTLFHSVSCLSKNR
ncbi:MAG TPA: hypothetical protein ENN17_11505 [bacterium]|nr:hypothetical protein [bacterium]